MMVETILESSQDFGMSSGSVPQWKRELLQRRAARPRPPLPPASPAPAPALAPPAVAPAPPCAAPPAVPNAPDDDEELRYGPGIVKRLQSRYLSLALREQPRRRALRRAASLEHLLDAPAPAPPARAPAPRPARPLSLALTLTPAAVTAAPAPRRDSIKRARSVDALSRLERRPQSPPRPDFAVPERPDADKSPTEPATIRGARIPRRPQPLLREAERPPVDLVRSALRKFEPSGRRGGSGGGGGPAARVAAVVRGLEPEPPALPPPAPRPPGAGVRPVSRAALDSIARAGSSTRYSFQQPRAAVNVALVQRRVGVIRPLPPATPPPRAPPAPDVVDKARLRTPPPEPLADTWPERKDAPPSAMVEPVPRSPPPPPPQLCHSTPLADPPLLNGHRSPPPSPPSPTSPASPLLPPSSPSPPSTPSPAPHEPAEPMVNGKSSKISAAKIERGWNTCEKKRNEIENGLSEKKSELRVTRVRGGGGAARGAGGGGAGVSVVFNFCSRKEVPDYIENDGVILRASKRDKIKAGDPGVVVLDPSALRSDSDSESESELRRPPSPCLVRFLNANVLINGKSSLQAAANRDRIAKLKLQFDDSLTRTFEYPSETSLCEEDSPLAAPPAAGPIAAPRAPPSAPHLSANTLIGMSALSGYTPAKTLAEEFRLGVTRPEAPPTLLGNIENGDILEGEGDGGGGECARSWTEARTHRTDLLF